MRYSLLNIGLHYYIIFINYFIARCTDLNDMGVRTIIYYYYYYVSYTSFLTTYKAYRVHVASRYLFVCLKE